MRKLLILALLFLPQISFASLSCTGNAIQDLSAPKGPLHPLRITNQDGLGICHIEQLHKLLKAKIPGHPDLSRVQLAIMEKKQRDLSGPVNKKAVRWRNEKGIGGTYIDAGNTCDAFNLVKNQHICPAGNDRFEQLTKNNPWDQEKIIETLSDYFDDRNKFPTFGTFANTYGETDFEKKLNYGFDACSIKKETFNALKMSYISHVKDQSKWFGTLYNKVLSDAQNVSIKSIKIHPKDFKAGKTYLAHLQEIFPKNSSSTYSKTAKTLESNILLVSKELEKNENCVVTKINELNETPFCMAPLGESAIDVLNLTSLGMSLREVSKIIDGNSDRDQFFSDAFSCNAPKIRIPFNLTCNKVQLTNYSKSSTNKEDFERKISEIIENKIVKGTPVGISTCTRYFNDPTAKTIVFGTENFNCGDKKATGHKNGEGSHAVTIIGSRCNKGIKEYLIQNSWGSSCSSYHKSYECTGTGGFWAPASVVIHNTRTLNILE